MLKFSDILFTTIAILDYSLARTFAWPFDMDSAFYTYAFPKILYPLNNIIFNASIGLTVVVAYERYISSIIIFKVKHFRSIVKHLAGVESF